MKISPKIKTTNKQRNPSNNRTLTSKFLFEMKKKILFSNNRCVFLFPVG